MFPDLNKRKKCFIFCCIQLYHYMQFNCCSLFVTLYTFIITELIIIILASQSSTSLSFGKFDVLYDLKHSFTWHSLLKYLFLVASVRNYQPQVIYLAFVQFLLLHCPAIGAGNNFKENYAYFND